MPGRCTFDRARITYVSNYSQELEQQNQHSATESDARLKPLSFERIILRDELIHYIGLVHMWFTHMCVLLLAPRAHIKHTRQRISTRDK